MKRFLIALSVTALLAALAIAAGVKLEGVKCIVSGEPVKESVSSNYLGGKVYFCCDGCVKSFKADSAKFATKARHQLVATGQAKQASCPVSGEPIAQEKNIEINGAKVFFCCDSCKGTVAKAAGDAQMNMAFGDAAWKKAAYKVGK